MQLRMFYIKNIVCANPNHLTDYMDPSHGLQLIHVGTPDITYTGKLSDGTSEETSDYTHA